MECTNVRSTSRCGGGRRSQPHHCETFCKRCTTMRSNRPFAAATARKCAICGGVFGCCLGTRSGAAWVLLGRCLGGAL
eukprot:11169938-Lingulodinium_polyedra.AAC.1